ncbi:MAG: CHASE3 domain-containing protein, partial [Chloroflexi bacterium]|nr:CHASE3 domain-containing protein [Chloroflexota bacterium]
MRSWPLRARLIIAFAAIGFVALVEAVFAFRAMQLNTSNDAWVEHTYQVITLADDAQKQVLAMRVAFAAYRSQGDAATLQTYNTAHAAYAASIQQLEQLTADNPAQVRRWQEIQHDVDSWVSTVVEPTLSGTPGVASTPIGSSPSQALFDDAQRMFADGVTVEKSLLDQRIKIADDGDVALKWMLFGGTLLEA